MERRRGEGPPASRGEAGVWLRRRLSIGFLVALGLLLLSAVGALWSTSGLSRTRALVQRSYALEGALESLHAAVSQAESARRGYAMDARERHRELFEEARAAAARQLARLDRLVVDADQRSRLARLDALVHRRLAGFGDLDEADALAPMERIRRTIEQMRLATDAVRDERLAADRAGQAWATWASSVSSVLAFALLSAAFVWIHRLLGERETALAELAQSEMDFRASFAAATVGNTHVDARTGLFLRVNRAFCAITGYDETELLHMGPSDLTHPDDREADAQLVERLLSGETARYETEKRYIRKDGAVIWVAASAALIRDAAGRPCRTVGTVIDVTAKRRADELLRERALVASVKIEVSAALGRGQALPDLLRNALSCIVDGLDVASAQVWLLDQAGSHLELQSAVGGSSQEPTVRARIPVGELLVGRIAATRRAHVARSPGDDELPAESGAEGADHVAAFGYPLLAGTDVLGVLAIYARRDPPAYALDALRDVAEEIARAVQHEKAEIERAQLLRTAQQAKQDAEASSRAKDDFLSILSHELRTPLNAVLGWTELLRMGAVEPAEIDEALETIEQNAIRQSQLIADILDVSRIVEGRLKLDVSRCQLDGVLAAALDTVRHAALAKSICLEVAGGNRRPIVGDAARLQQVLWNLLSNAIKFTPSGGTVKVELGDAGSHAVIVVSDDGCGISPQFLPHLFDRFTQEDVSSTREQSGVGLGMSITRHLVEMHGGSIEAASEGVGRGATFTVRLPYAAQAALTEEPAGIDLGGDEAAAATRPLADVRVLLVDDERDTLRAVERTLRFFGATVVTASCAADALQRFAEQPPDVLVSDVAMPGEDGYALIRQVRSRPPEGGGAVPAIALTAFAGAEDRRRLLAAGFQMHLAKPVEPSRLVSTIGRLAS